MYWKSGSLCRKGINRKCKEPTGNDLTVNIDEGVWLLTLFIVRQSVGNSGQCYRKSSSVEWKYLTENMVVWDLYSDQMKLHWCWIDISEWRQMNGWRLILSPANQTGPLMQNRGDLSKLGHSKVLESRLMSEKSDKRTLGDKSQYQAGAMRWWNWVWVTKRQNPLKEPTSACRGLG